MLNPKRKEISMSVTLLKNGKYKVRVREGGRGSKQHTDSTFGSLHEAADFEAFLLRRFGKTPNAGLTFKELAKRYEDYFSTRLKSYEEKSIIMSQLVRHFGGHKVASFNAVLVENYQTELLKDGSKVYQKKVEGEIIEYKKPCSPSTVNRHVANLKAMFSWAADKKRGYVTKEVNEDIHSVEMFKENNSRLRYLSREEADRLLFHCIDYLKPIVIAALYTGMRKGELINLRWGQVDLVNDVILLSQADTKNKERRELPINNTVKQAFKGLIRSTKTDLVFWRKEGRDMKYIRKAFAGACKRAKIQDFKFHDLRHTFASWLVQQGTPIKTVQELLGHKSLTMTMRYAHLAPDNRKDAVNLLDTNRGTLVVRQNEQNAQ